MVKMVMLAEAFVILFLSSWLYEEYVSNPFMGAYVNGFIQSDTGALAILGAVVALVGLMTTGLLYRAKSARSVEVVSTESRPPAPAPRDSQKLEKGVGPEMSGPLHPVVAALKAEIAATASTVGSVSGLNPEVLGVPIAPAGNEEPLPANVLQDTTETRPVLKKAEPESQAEAKPVSH